MVKFTAPIKKFASHGEKTGWTYIDVPPDIAERLKPKNKKSFRVKGKLDNCIIKGIALLPAGGGAFIMALNKLIRKCIGKGKGAILEVQIEPDPEMYVLNADFVTCLADEPSARLFFSKLTRSHQNYFSKWIDSAKTDQTRTKRIAITINALSRKMGFGEMLRSQRNE